MSLSAGSHVVYLCQTKFQGVVSELSDHAYSGVSQWTRERVKEGTFPRAGIAGVVPLSRGSLRYVWREGTGFRKVQLDRGKKE